MSETPLAVAQEAAWGVRMSDPEEFERRVAALPDDPVTDFLRARVELGRGHLDEVLTLCREAEQGIPASSIWRARLCETRGNVLDGLGLDDDAQHNLAAAWTLYQQLGDLRGLASARQNMGALRTQTPEQALEIYREALLVARESGDPDVVGVIEGNLAAAKRELGMPSSVVAEHLERSYALLSTSWPDGALDTLCSMLELSLEDGDLEQARRIAEQVPQPVEVPEPRMRANTASVLAQLAGALGDHERAVEVLGSALASGLRAEDEVMLRHRYSHALAAAGRTQAALREAHRAFDDVLEQRKEEQTSHARALGTWYRTELLRQERARERQRADALETALRDLRVATHRIHELSIRDAVTGLHNRQYLRDHGATVVRRARPDTPVEVSIIDLDHFKAINDTYGHTAGDSVLATFSRALRDHLPASDVVARYGGEEFVVVRPPRAPGAPGRPLVRDLESLRSVLKELTTVGPDGETLPTVTMSVGVCSVGAGSLDAALVRADRLMYQAKAAGRDRIVGDEMSTTDKT